MRSSLPPTLLATMLVASLAHAQGKPIEKCTGNFEEAQLKEKRGKLVEAEELYAACAAPTCPSMIRADCEAKRDEVLKRMPTVTIVVRDPAGNDLVAKVDIDGKPITDRTRAVPVDPGEHVVNYKVGGGFARSQKIGVVEGEKARVITITFREGDAKPAAAAAAPPAEPSSPAPAAPPPQQPDRSEGPAIVGPVILGSVGVIILGAGVIMQVLAINEDNKAQDLRQSAQDPDTPSSNRLELEKAASSRQDAAKNNQLIAIVAGTGGILFLAGGITWFIVSRMSSSKSAAAFSPVVAPGYAGASFGLRF